MWVKIKDTIVFESINTPKALSWSAANRALSTIRRVIQISLLVGVLAGIGVLVSRGGAHVATVLFIAAALVLAFASMRWDSKDESLSALTKSILEGRLRQHYATPADFSYQVIPRHERQSTDNALAEAYFMNPVVRKLDARIKEKPEELSAEWARNRRDTKLNVISMAEEMLKSPDRVVELRAEAEAELREALHAASA